VQFAPEVGAAAIKKRLTTGANSVIKFTHIRRKTVFGGTPNLYVSFLGKGFYERRMRVW
jgi:hypothetical protein